MAYAFTRRQNNQVIDATHINELQVAIEDISTNGSITVANSTSIALALVAGELTASAVFGTTAGTIAEGSALALKADAEAFNTHASRDDNPHGVTKAQVGLANVNNTSDLDKPISVATQLALDGKAATSHIHEIADVTDLEDELDNKSDILHLHDDRYFTESEVTTLLSGKANTSHTHTIANTTGLQAALDGKASTGHNHDAAYSPLGHNHDDRYFTEAETNSLLGGKANTAHTHAIADTTGLQAALDSKSATTHNHDEDYADIGHLHDNRYYTETEVDTFLGTKSNTGHGHAIADTTGLQAALDSKSATTHNHDGVYAFASHTHVVADVTGLQTALDGKAAASHTHGVADLTATGTKNTTTYLRGDNTWAVPPNTTYTLATQAEVENAASTTARLVSGQRLAQAVAYHAPVKTADLSAHTSRTDNPHGVTKTQVGLGNVDNTSDSDKPISTATQIALDGKSNTGHTHTSTNVTDFSEAVRDTMGTALVGGSNMDIAVDDVANTITLNSSMPAHNHDDRYFTETETNTLLAGKSNTGHTHAIADTTNLQSTLDAKADDTDLSAHTSATNNPHGVTKAQVGLGSVPNTDATQRSNHTGTQLASTISDFSTAADARINAQKGVANGLATLGADSRIPSNQIPPIAMTETYVVASQAAQIALSAQEGDVVVRTDLSRTFIHNGGTAGTMADWQEMATPSDAVLSVNSKTGSVVLTKTDVGLGNVDNTSDLNKPISTATQTALDGKANSSHTHAAGDIASGTLALARIPTGTTSSTVALGNHTHAGYALTSHSHAISDVTGLQTALDGKAASSHTHVATTDLTATGTKNSTTFLRGDNTWAVPPNTTYNVLTQAQVENASDSTNSGLVTGQRLSQAVAAHAPVKTADLATKANVSHTHDAGDVTSGTFNIARIPTGTTSSTVALGNHTHAGYASTSHTHVIGDVTGLQAALDGKAASSHTHTAANVTDFAETVRDTMGVALVAGSNITITPDDTADTITIAATGTGPHDHDDRYYTESEIDTALAGKANTSHTHHVNDMTATGTKSSSTYLRGDNTWATPTNTTYTAISQAEVENSASTTARLVTGQRVYQAIAKWAALATHTHAIGDVSGLQTALDGKAASVHTHAIADVTGLQTALDAKASTTHTHASTEVTDFEEAVRDTMGTALIGGTNITLAVDDVANTLTINSAITSEVIRDVIGQTLVGGSGVTVTPNDAADTITFDSTPVVVATTTPASPTQGTLWWDSDEPADPATTITEILNATDEHYYRATAVDAMYEAQVDAINLRQESFPLISTRRYNTITHGVGGVNTTSNINVSAGQIRTSLVYIREPITASAIGITVTTAGVGSAVRLGIASYDFATHTATLILDAGTVDGSTTGSKSISITQALPAGWIALLVCPSVTTGIQGVYGISGYEWDTANDRPLCGPVQTGSAYGTFGATESMNTSSNLALTTWIEVA